MLIGVAADPSPDNSGTLILVRVERACRQAIAHA